MKENKIKNLEILKNKIKALENEIKNKYNAEIIGIFGSYAKGKKGRKNDIDLLVKFYKGTTLFEFIGLSIFLEEKLGVKKVDVVPYDSIREELKDKIAKETIYL